MSLELETRGGSGGTSRCYRMIVTGVLSPVSFRRLNSRLASSKGSRLANCGNKLELRVLAQRHNVP
ncbi:hypothetical protein E2C01_085802 [Portunus trituberculatus]|uniref:Uncharacterized protein n=1 Tax=Portunus trituberculatus TaxID=210409 RepID=A0A5B7IZ35_PORTR|nr:hypothetical protein [Portunus trituberculatus]